MNKHLPCTILLLIALSIPLFGCDQHKTTPAPVRVAPKELLKVPFKEAITPDLFELPSGAITTWRKFAEYRPTLILFSSVPLLDPIAENKLPAIQELLRSASDAEIIRRGQIEVADPVFFSAETVSVALDQNYFSEIVLMLPKKRGEKELSLQAFRNVAVEYNFLTKAEGDSLTEENGVFSGTIRGHRLRAVTTGTIPAITTPVIVHLDLGYFKDEYIDEVKTPSYDLILQVADSLRSAGCPALAMTMSFSNQENGYSLDSRFMVRDIAEAARNPQYLNGEAPPSWSLRAAMLYAHTMFSESRAGELAVQAAQLSPPDPAALYTLAMMLLQKNRVEEGFAALDRAVALDKGYGLAYKDLALQGMEIGKIDKAIELLSKYCALVPDNPFLRLLLADMLIRNGRGKEALPLLGELSRLPWSPVHAQIPEQLKLMTKVATEQPAGIVPLPQGSQSKPSQVAPKGMKFNHMGMGIPGK